MDNPSAWLEFPSNERVFLTGTCTLGRAPENRVVIALDGISRRHAVIRQGEDGGWILMDMGSSNGTYLNGERLSRPAPLRDGCIIEIGQQRIIFRTPPELEPRAGAEPVPEVECWLLVVAATQLGCRTPSDALGDKTFESWSERCQRLVVKFRGKVLRALGDGFLAYWPADGAGSAKTVAAVLTSLRTMQRASEEFRVGLHCGKVSMRTGATGATTPTGPEVIFTLQLDRLIHTLDQSVIITNPARDRLGEMLPTRHLTSAELRTYSGSARLFTPA